MHLLPPSIRAGCLLPKAGAGERHTLGSLSEKEDIGAGAAPSVWLLGKWRWMTWSFTSPAPAFGGVRPSRAVQGVDVYEEVRYMQEISKALYAIPGMSAESQSFQKVL